MEQGARECAEVQFWRKGWTFSSAKPVRSNPPARLSPGAKSIDKYSAKLACTALDYSGTFRFNPQLIRG